MHAAGSVSGSWSHQDSLPGISSQRGTCVLTSEADGEKLSLLPWLRFPFPPDTSIVAGFDRLFQEGDTSALARTGDGVQRRRGLGQPPLSCQARWAALCLPVWSVCLGSQRSAYISSSWRETFCKSKYLGEREKCLTEASSSQRSQPPATTLATRN